jgi:uncharacterized protein (TIGR02285 family)
MDMKHLAKLLFALSAGMAGPLAADSITWVGADFPPMAMSQGEHAHQGYIDAMFIYLQKSLPQHRFQEQIVPWQRAMYMAEQGGPVCLISAFQTQERDKFLRFTEPYGYLFPIGVVTHKQDLADFTPYLNDEGALRLDALLADQNLRLGVASGRSYGPTIDAQLHPLINSKTPHLQQVYQAESTSTLLKMLAYQRFDYTLSYPSEVVYYSPTHTDLQFYPIEGNNQLLPGRLSCSRDPATDRVFSDLTNLLRTNGHDKVFRDSYERWLPEYLIENYRKMVAELKPG